MSGQPTNEPGRTHEDSLAEAVHASELLLTYAVEHGIRHIKKSQIDTLVHSKHVRATRELNEEEEAAFWDAYHALCVATTPVSRESLEATMPRLEERRFRRRSRWVSEAEKTVQANQRLSVIAILSLLILQTLWFFVSTVLEDIHKIDDEIAVTSASLSTVRKKEQLLLLQERYAQRRVYEERSEETYDETYDERYEDREPQVEVSKESYDLDEEGRRLENKTLRLQSQWEANMQFLTKVNLLSKVLRGNAPDERTTEGEIEALDETLREKIEILQAKERKRTLERREKIASYWQAEEGSREVISKEIEDLDNQVEKEEWEVQELRQKMWALRQEALTEARERERYQIQTSRILSETLYLYLLPILYGWVGACAHILRTLSQQIRTRTFAHSFRVLRMILGALAGLSVAWFVEPQKVGTAGIVVSLTPLALAFLAGYSIELVFSAMDTVIGAFTKDTSPGSSPA